MSRIPLRIAAFALAAGAAFAQAQRPTRIDDATLRNAAQSKGEEWISYGFTPQETRYSPLNQINATNVSRLGLAWSYEVGDGGGGQEATPLVHNGTLYSITQWSVVFAVDVKTGKQKWRWDPEVNQTAVRPKICCGNVMRGIALYDGKVIAPAIDGRLFALDEETGKPVWEARVAYPQDNYTVTMAPRIAKGKVIIGVSGAEYPVRGMIAAYDAKTGQQAWKFYTVPGPGDKDPGLIKAAATWPKTIVGGGGGTVWDAISYDPDLELVYIGTGNAGPWSEDTRMSKGFDLLYAASIVAVDVNTGLYKWHFQNVPGDEWDFDSVQHLLLADVTIKGQKRKVIMQANKNGFFYVLDRITGEFISAQPFSRVTWAKGIDQKTGRPIINQEVMYGTNPVPVSPGGGGAHNWSPMSFNPQTGLVYIPSRGWDTFNYATDPEFKPDSSKVGGSSQTGLKSDTRNLPRQPAGPAIGPEPLEGGNVSTLVAYDPVKQEVRWRKPVGNSRFGGTLSTASNLVFQVAPSGSLMVWSADKGEQLLELPTGLVSGMGPPITFLVDGKQYIALMGGNGGAATLGTANPGAQTSAQKPMLLVFGLDGKAELPKQTGGATAAGDPH